MKLTFKVAVNGQHLLQFKHRVPPQEVNALSISGDVKLTKVSINGRVIRRNI